MISRSLKYSAHSVKKVAFGSGLDLTPCPKNCSAKVSLKLSAVFSAKTAFGSVIFVPS